MGLFSCSIPPWFVLSCNLPMTNARAIWLCFGAFLSPPASSLQLHWPLATDHHSPVPRSTPGPAGSGHAQTFPHWLLPDTDRRFVKDRTGSNLDERSSSLVWHQTGPCLRKNRSVFPRSPPLDRRPFSRTGNGDGTGNGEGGPRGLLPQGSRGSVRALSGIRLVIS